MEYLVINEYNDEQLKLFNDCFQNKEYWDIKNLKKNFDEIIETVELGSGVFSYSKRIIKIDNFVSFLEDINFKKIYDEFEFSFYYLGDIEKDKNRKILYKHEETGVLINICLNENSDIVEDIEIKYFYDLGNNYFLFNSFFKSDSSLLDIPLERKRYVNESFNAVDLLPVLNSVQELNLVNDVNLIQYDSSFKSFKINLLDCDYLINNHKDFLIKLINKEIFTEKPEDIDILSNYFLNKFYNLEDDLLRGYCLNEISNSFLSLKKDREIENLNLNNLLDFIYFEASSKLNKDIIFKKSNDRIWRVFEQINLCLMDLNSYNFRFKENDQEISLIYKWKERLYPNIFTSNDYLNNIDNIDCSKINFKDIDLNENINGLTFLHYCFLSDNDNTLSYKKESIDLNISSFFVNCLKNVNKEDLLRLCQEPLVNGETLPVFMFRVGVLDDRYSGRKITMVYFKEMLEELNKIIPANQWNMGQNNGPFNFNNVSTLLGTYIKNWRNNISRDYYSFNNFDELIEPFKSLGANINNDIKYENIFYKTPCSYVKDNDLFYYKNIDEENYENRNFLFPQNNFIKSGYLKIYEHMLENNEMGKLDEAGEYMSGNELQDKIKIKESILNSLMKKEIFEEKSEDKFKIKKRRI